MTSPTTPSLPDALRACIELGAQNPSGDLMLATSCSWRRILVGFRQLPYLVPSVDSDGHPNLECGEQFAHAEEVIACVNLIRQHGPALEQSLRSLADENRALLRERDELRRVLSNLHAMVWGECPSLLNEDSGGSGELDLEIRELIAGPKP